RALPRARRDDAPGLLHGSTAGGEPPGARVRMMHYRNGREAQNGDKVVRLEGGKIVAFGVLHGAVPGNDYCNGNIAVVQTANEYACMVDCLHVDDLADLLKTAGLDDRPAGK
ncbi:hypothetical protein, partial [Zavarzinia sp.]|uniref:hypothetical protein n=1 Tax=Zavarzinia sp. TaxID=2027920 RepID=UPI0035616AF7